MHMTLAKKSALVRLSTYCRFLVPTMALGPRDKWDTLRQAWQSSASIVCTENAYTCLVCQKAVDLQLLVERSSRSTQGILQAFY